MANVDLSTNNNQATTAIIDLGEESNVATNSANDENKTTATVVQPGYNSTDLTVGDAKVEQVKPDIVSESGLENTDPEAEKAMLPAEIERLEAEYARDQVTESMMHGRYSKLNEQCSGLQDDLRQMQERERIASRFPYFFRDPVDDLESDTQDESTVSTDETGMETPTTNEAGGSDPDTHN